MDGVDTITEETENVFTTSNDEAPLDSSLKEKHLVQISTKVKKQKNEEEIEDKDIEHENINIDFGEETREVKELTEEE